MFAVEGPVTRDHDGLTTHALPSFSPWVCFASLVPPHRNRKPDQGRPASWQSPCYIALPQYNIYSGVLHPIAYSTIDIYVIVVEYLFSRFLLLKNKTKVTVQYEQRTQKLCTVCIRAFYIHLLFQFLSQDV